MAFDFRSILSTPVDEIERPKSIPACHCFATIASYEFGTTRGNGTPYVRFTYNNLRPGPDCDQELLDLFERSPAEGGINLADRPQRQDMWLTARSLNRLDKMMDAVLGPNTNKRTCDERLPEMIHAEVLIGLSPRMNEDGSDSGYNDVTSVVAAPQN